MRRPFRFLVLAFPLLALAPSEALGQAEWTQFSSDDGTFRAVFPKTPEINSGSEIKAGIASTTHVVAASNIGVFCSVSYTDYSPRLGGSPREELESNREDFLNQFRATLVESHDSILEHARGEPLPALAFAAVNETDAFRLFVAVDGLRSYIILAASDKTSPNDADMDRCIDGFHLTR